MAKKKPIYRSALSRSAQWGGRRYAQDAPLIKNDAWLNTIYGASRIDDTNRELFKDEIYPKTPPLSIDEILVEESRKDRSTIGDFVDSMRSTMLKIAQANVLSDEMEIQKQDEVLLDIEKLKHYKDLVKQRKDLSEQLEAMQDMLKWMDKSDPSIWGQINATNELIDKYKSTVGEINDLTSYFKGEGRTHDIIAQNMFDAEKATDANNLSMIWDRFNVGTGNTDRAFASNRIDEKILAATGMYPAMDALTYASNIYDLAEKGITKLLPTWAGGSDRGYFTSEAIKTAPDGASYLDDLYVDDDSVLKWSDNRFSIWENTANRKKNEGLVRLRRSLDFYQNGNMYFPDLSAPIGDNLNYTSINVYRPDKINPSFKADQEAHSHEFWHPLYMLPELGSTIAMSGGMIASIAADVAMFAVTKRLPTFIGKLNPKYGRWMLSVKTAQLTGDNAALSVLMQQAPQFLKQATMTKAAQLALTEATVGTNITMAKWSRYLETSQEAIDAQSSKILKESQRRGVNTRKVYNDIQSYANTIGINTDGLEPQDLIGLAIAYDIPTGDLTFNSIRKDSKEGLMKLINANNSLAYIDYLQTLPFLSYSGKIMNKFVDKMGRLSERFLSRNFINTEAGRTARAMQNSRAMSLQGDDLFTYYAPSLQGVIDNKVSNIAKRAYKYTKNPGAALALKHTLEKGGNFAKTLFGIRALEGLEEANLTLLQHRYERGEYNNYRAPYNAFSIPEVFYDVRMSADAIANLMGINAGDPDNGDDELTKATLIGYFIGGVHGHIGSIASNLRNDPNAKSFRNYVGQLRNDFAMNKLIGNNYANIEDHQRISLFFDVLNKTNNNISQARKSLNDFKLFLDEDSLVDKQFIDDDILLLEATNMLYNSSKLNLMLKDKKVAKGSEKHREIIKLGAKSIVDAYKNSRNILDQLKEIQQVGLRQAKAASIYFSDDKSESEELYMNEVMQEFPELKDIFADLEKLYEEHRAIDEQNKTKVRDQLKIARVKSEEEGNDNWLNPKEEYAKLALNDLYIEWMNELYNLGEENTDWDSFLQQLKTNDLLLGRYYDKVVDARIKVQDKKTFILNQFMPLLDYWYEQQANSLKDFLNDREQVLSEYRKITGLDVNTKGLLGMSNELSNILNQIKKQRELRFKTINQFRKSIGEPEIGYEEYFGKYEHLKSGIQQTRDLLYLLLLNKSVFGPQKTLARMFAQFSENPSDIRTAIFGNDETTFLEKEIKEVDAQIAQREGSDELERNDMIIDREISKSQEEAAWKTIDKMVLEAERRKNIAHRRSQEEQPIVGTDVLSASEGNTEAQTKVSRQAKQVLDFNNLGEEDIDSLHSISDMLVLSNELLQNTRLFAATYLENHQDESTPEQHLLNNKVREIQERSNNEILNRSQSNEVLITDLSYSLAELDAMDKFQHGAGTRQRHIEEAQAKAQLEAEKRKLKRESDVAAEIKDASDNVAESAIETAEALAETKEHKIAAEMFSRDAINSTKISDNPALDYVVKTYFNQELISLVLSIEYGLERDSKILEIVNTIQEPLRTKIDSIISQNGLLENKTWIALHYLSEDPLLAIAAMLLVDNIFFTNIDAAVAFVKNAFENNQLLSILDVLYKYSDDELTDDAFDARVDIVYTLGEIGYYIDENNKINETPIRRKATQEELENLPQKYEGPEVLNVSIDEWLPTDWQHAFIEQDDNPVLYGTAWNDDKGFLYVVVLPDLEHNKTHKDSKRYIIRTISVYRYGNGESNNKVIYIDDDPKITVPQERFALTEFPNGVKSTIPLYSVIYALDEDGKVVSINNMEVPDNFYEEEVEIPQDGPLNDNEDTIDDEDPIEDNVTTEQPIEETEEETEETELKLAQQQEPTENTIEKQSDLIIVLKQEEENASGMAEIISAVETEMNNQKAELQFAANELIILHDLDGNFYLNGEIIPQQYAEETARELNLMLMLEETKQLFDLPYANGKVKRDNVEDKDAAWDYVSETFFYNPNPKDPKGTPIDKPIELKVNGKLVKLPHELRSGRQLAKQLIKKGWFLNTKKYYIVTESLQAANNRKWGLSPEDQMDSFTVVLILDDGEYCYALALRKLGKEYDDKGVFDVDNEGLLRQRLAKLHVDYNQMPGNTEEEKLYNIGLRRFKELYQVVKPSPRDEQSLEYLEWEQEVRNLYSGTVPSELADQIFRMRREADQQARLMYRYRDRTPLTPLLIDDLIELLRATRNAIINAYLTKDDTGQWVFPEEPRIDQVKPVNVSLSNGQIENARGEYGEPIYRKIDEGSTDEITQKMLPEAGDNQIILGYGTGMFSGDINDPESHHQIIGLGKNATVVFGGKGLAGKIYWIVQGPNGAFVPIMLREQRFDRHYITKTEYRLITEIDPKKDLVLDPLTGEIVNPNKLPSAAEVILYMLTNKIDANQMPSLNKESSTVDAFLEMFVHHNMAPAENRLEGKLGLDYYIAKQFIYAPLTEGGAPVLQIGIKQQDGSYKVEVFTDEQLFGANSDNTRAFVVNAIAQLMHWNTEKIMMGSTFLDEILSKVISELKYYFDTHPGETEFSLYGVPQFTFQKDQLFEDVNGTLIAKKVSYAAWMIANGKLMTDTTNNVFYAPFVFANGVETTGSVAALKIATDNGAVLTGDSGVIVEHNLWQGTPENIKTMEDLLGVEFVINKDGDPERQPNQKAFVVLDTSELIDDVLTKLYIIDKYEKFAHDYNATHKGNEIPTEVDDLILDAVTRSQLQKEPYAEEWFVTIRVYDNPELNLHNLVKILMYPNTLQGLSQVKQGIDGVYSLNKGEGKVNEKKARKWIAHKLGLKQTQIVAVNGLIRGCDDASVWGLTNLFLDTISHEITGMIQFSKIAGRGIHFHEAWHYVNLLLHDAKTRKQLYKEFQEEHKEYIGRPQKEIEEAMAEDFRKYMNLYTSYTPVALIRRAYDAVLGMVFGSRHKQAYRQVYKNIKNGLYAGVSLDPQSKLEFMRRYPNGIPASYIVDAVSQQTLDNMLNIEDRRDFFETAEAVVNHIMNNMVINSIHDLKEYASRDAAEKQILPMVKAYADELRDLHKNEYLADKVMDMYNNPEAFRAILLSKFEELGLRARFKYLNQVDNSAEEESAQGEEILLSDNEQSDPDAADSMAHELEENPTMNYDRFDLEFSRRETANLATKLFLRRIPMYYLDENNIPQILYDDFYNVKYYDMGESWTRLYDDLWACDSFADTETVNGKLVYKGNSILGTVQRYAQSNDLFYYSVHQMLDKLVKSKNKRDILLRSLIFSTLCSSLLNVMYIQIEDPFVKKNPMAGLTLGVDMQTDPLLSGGTKSIGLGDRDRLWKLTDDNIFRAALAHPRRWSKSFATSRAIKNGVLDAEYVKDIKEKYERIINSSKDAKVTPISQYSTTKRGSKRGSTLTEDQASKDYKYYLNKVVSLYNDLAIPVDYIVIDQYISNKAVNNTNMAKMLALYDFVKNKSKADGSLGGIISLLTDPGSIGNSELTVNKNNKKPISEIYERYKKGTIMFELAALYSKIHPSRSDFSVQDPNGNMLYPVSLNSFITDRVRWMNMDDKLFVKSLMLSPYSFGSLILEHAMLISENSDTKITVGSFVGVKDKNRNNGGDYFNITPLEDFLSKLFMTENDLLILPTMADKKTWHTINIPGLELSHDIVLAEFSKTYKENAILAYYNDNIEQSPEDVLKRSEWKTRAMNWYEKTGEGPHATDEDLILVNADIEAAHNKVFRRFSNKTLNVFAKYFIAELNSLIKYYSKPNIKNIIENENKRITNYHGSVIESGKFKGRLDLSGNGGFFRYFYDTTSYRDDSGVRYNMNLQIELLWKLQQKIENGEISIKNAQDSIKTIIGVDVIEDFDLENADGFELIRSYLNSILKKYTQGVAGNTLLRASINTQLIELVDSQMEILANENSPLKCAKKDKDGRYIPEAIPSQFLLRYMDEMVKMKMYGNSKIYEAANSAGPNALYSLIANYVANSMRSIIEFEKVFQGDPAMFKRRKIKGQFGTTSLSFESINNLLEGKDAGEINPILIEVNNYWDTFSDKIKRLGGLLSPGAEIRLDYTENELKLYPELNVTKYANLVVKDIMAKSSSYELTKLIFKQQLIVDYLRCSTDAVRDKVVAQLGKWYKKNNKSTTASISMVYATILSSEKYANQLYDELSKSNDDFKSFIDENTEKQSSPYSDGQINVADALVFISPELYRKIRIGLGNWTFGKNSDEEAFNIILKDDTWMNDPEKAAKVANLSLYPLKMSYYQNDPYNIAQGLSINKPIYNKMAIFPLFKFNTGSETGRILYERMHMRGNELDMISFESAVKVGAPLNSILLINNTDPKGLISEFNLESIFKQSDKHVTKNNNVVSNTKNDDTLAVEIQDLKNLRMQLNTEAHEAEVRAIGTQMFKIAFSNIFDDYQYGRGYYDMQGNGKTGQKRYGLLIREDIMACINALTQIGAKTIRDRYYTTKEVTDKSGKQRNVLLVNRGAIRALVRLIIKNNGLGQTAREIIENGGVAAALMSRTLFEHSVSAAVNREIVDITTHGGTAVQQSNVGFTAYGKSNVLTQDNGKYYYTNADGSKTEFLTGGLNLQFVNFNNGNDLEWNRKDGSMEIILSLNFFRSVLPKAFQESYESSRLWLINHDIIKGIKRSFKTSEGVEDNVSEKEEGKQNKPKPFGVGYRIPTQGMSSMFVFTVADVLPRQSADTIIVPREFTAQTGSDYDVDKIFLATLAYLVDNTTHSSKLAAFDNLDLYANDSKLNQAARTKAYIEDGNISAILNKMLMSYMDVIADIANYGDSRGSIDTFTDIIRDDVLSVLSEKHTSYIPGGFELTPVFLSSRKSEFITGKSGIGPFALNITNLALTLLTHLSFDYGDNPYNFGHMDEVYGKDKLRISGWLSAMVNAHVDVAKDPYVFTLNVNLFTYNHINFLLRAGMGKSAFMFIAQPAIKKLADLVNNSGGIYGRNVDGSNPQERSAYIRKNKIYSSILYKYIVEFANLLNSLTKESGIDDAFLKKMVTAFYMVSNKFKYTKKMPLVKLTTEFLQKYVKLIGEKPAVDYQSEIFTEDNKTKTLNSVRAYRGEYSDNVTERIYHTYFLLMSLLAFNDVDVYAEKLSKLVLASLIDTKKFGNTISEHINFDSRIKDLIYNTTGFIIVGEEEMSKPKKDQKGKLNTESYALRKYFKQSFLNTKFYLAKRYTQALLQGQLMQATPQFNMLFSTVCGILNGTTSIITEDGKTISIFNYIMRKKAVDSISTAIDNVMRYHILKNVGKSLVDMPSKQEGEGLFDEQDDYKGPIDFTMNGDVMAVRLKMLQLLFDTEDNLSLFTRIQNFIQNIPNNKKYRDLQDKYDKSKIGNEFLTYITPQSPTTTYPIGRLILAENQMETDPLMKTKLRSAYYQLLSHDNPQVRKLARDIAFYAYYSTYDLNTRDAFFDLVPSEFRKQYDLSLSKAMNMRGDLFSRALLNSIGEEGPVRFKTSLSGNEGLAQHYIDVISRNYWYNDDIVPAFSLGDTSSTDLNNPFVEWTGQNRRAYEDSSERFPGFIATTKCRNHSPYIKVVKSGRTVLYKRVGEINRTKEHENKSGKITRQIELQIIDIYVAVPKVGLHIGKINQFELYAGYGVPSIFELNKIPFEWTLLSDKAAGIVGSRESIESVVNNYQKRQDDNKAYKDVEITWFGEVPQLYQPIIDGSHNELIYLAPQKDIKFYNQQGTVSIRPIETTRNKTTLQAATKAVGNEGLIILLGSISDGNSISRPDRVIVYDDQTLDSEITSKTKSIVQTSESIVSRIMKQLETDENRAKTLAQGLIYNNPDILANKSIKVAFIGNIDNIEVSQKDIDDYVENQVNKMLYSIEIPDTDEDVEATKAELERNIRPGAEAAVKQEKANSIINAIVLNLLLKGIRISELIGVDDTVLSRAVAYAQNLNSDYIGYSISTGSATIYTSLNFVKDIDNYTKFMDYLNSLEQDSEDEARSEQIKQIWNWYEQYTHNYFNLDQFAQEYELSLLDQANDEALQLEDEEINDEESQGSIGTGTDMLQLLQSSASDATVLPSGEVLLSNEQELQQTQLLQQEESKEQSSPTGSLLDMLKNSESDEFILNDATKENPASLKC